MKTTHSIKAKLITGSTLLVLSLATVGLSLVLQKEDTAQAVINWGDYCTKYPKAPSCTETGVDGGVDITIVNPVPAMQFLQSDVVSVSAKAVADGTIKSITVKINKYNADTQAVDANPVVNVTKAYSPAVSSTDYILPTTTPWLADPTKAVGYYKLDISATDSLNFVSNKTLIFSVVDRIPTMTSTYEGQWVYSQVLKLTMWDKDQAFSSGAAKYDVAVGPSEWKVRICVNGTIDNGVGYNLGLCKATGDPMTMRTIEETWSVMKWAEPDHVIDGSAFQERTVNQFHVLASTVPADEATLKKGAAGPAAVGTCEGSGKFTRSGLYGVSFDEGSDCKGNYGGGWWSYSMLPLKWKVSGEIKDN